MKNLLMSIWLRFFPVKEDKIGTAQSVKIQLMLIFTAIWLLFQALFSMILVIALLVYVKIGGNEMPEMLKLINLLFFLPGTLLTLMILNAQLSSITINVLMNQGMVLLNTLTGEKRAAFDGLNVKLWWETVQYIVDLEVTMPSEINETFPTKDGSIKVKASIMSKPNSGKHRNEGESKGQHEIRRSKHLVAFVEFEPDTIKMMQEAKAREIMRESFKELTCDEAKNKEGYEILNESDFEKLEDELHIDITEALVFDIDYNDKVQEAKNSVAVAETSNQIIDKLMENGRHTLEQAKVLAELINSGVRSEKKTEEKTYNLSPSVIAALKEIFGRN